MLLKWSIYKIWLGKPTIHVLPQVGAPAIPDQLYDIQILLADTVSDHEMHARDDTLVHDGHSLCCVIFILTFKERGCVLIQLLQGVTRSQKFHVRRCSNIQSQSKVSHEPKEVLKYLKLVMKTDINCAYIHIYECLYTTIWDQ